MAAHYSNSIKSKGSLSHLVVFLFHRVQLLSHPLLATPLGGDEVLQLTELVVVHRFEPIFVEVIVLLAFRVPLQREKSIAQTEAAVLGLIK